MTWPLAAQSHLASRAGIDTRWLVWLDVADPAGDPFGVGFWTGDDHQTITAEGQSRLYYGAQGSLVVPPINYAGGTTIQSLDIRMAVSPEAETVVRGYQTRFGRAEVHCALFDPAGMQLRGLRKYFRGIIDGNPLVTPEVNGAASITLKLVSAARRGTMTQNGRKSDEAQRARHAGDRFRKYGALGRVTSDAWGTR
ncbi:hypothetical protein [Wenxinia saemankumensis]|uniref:Uncharacterized protein n=1 Tax=Wenxinia saemankumensis TaxID=1447782 RepID=A0A1M6F0A9_9RHOB|nr:hypothetical protein [Wenxinia saemankumensis]SHI91123.1 hypothetical protein SAMN05444417_2280 [Wenxinia saemankumensis]